MIRRQANLALLAQSTKEQGQFEISYLQFTEMFPRKILLNHFLDEHHLEMFDRSDVKRMRFLDTVSTCNHTANWKTRL